MNKRKDYCNTEIFNKTDEGKIKLKEVATKIMK